MDAYNRQNDSDVFSYAEMNQIRAASAISIKKIRDKILDENLKDLHKSDKDKSLCSIEKFQK